jgi:hypothetical protein
MHSYRLLSISFVAATSALSILASCGGGGGGGGGGDIDAHVTVKMDAHVFDDAPGSGSNTANAVGQMCSQTVACPTGFDCLAGSGATTGFCSQACNGGSDTTTCGMNYTGKGLAACVIVTSATGSDADHCDVICQASNAQVCPATQCDGTCPGGSTCSESVGSGSNTAKLCQ